MAALRQRVVVGLCLSGTAFVERKLCNSI